MCTTATPAPAAAPEAPAQLAGKCPCCGEPDLSYGDSGVEDSQYYYDWTCPSCEGTGTEWFDLVFSEHIIKTPAAAPAQAAA